MSGSETDYMSGRKSEHASGTEKKSGSQIRIIFHFIYYFYICEYVLYIVIFAINFNRLKADKMRGCKTERSYRSPLF